MKRYLFVLFFPLSLKAQLLTKNDLLIGGIQLISGASDGSRDQCLHHPNELFRQFPNLNRSFWDVRQSWNNNRWAAFKDAQHTFKTITNTLDLSCIAIAVFEKNKTVKRAIIKTGFAYLCRKVGFHLIYSGLFKNKLSWH